MGNPQLTKTFLGTALSALVVFGSTNRAESQTVPRIAFQAPVAGNRRTSYNQIFSMNPDGSGRVQLTSVSPGASASRWSPGQQYISFWRSSTLWLMQAKAEANGARSFAVAPAGGFGSDWSPDVSSLVYRGTSSNLYIVPINAAAGTAGSPVLFRTGYYYDPSWSPDGTRIAFWGSDNGNTGTSVRVRDVATGAEISFALEMTGTPEAQGPFAPQWSPH